MKNRPKMKVDKEAADRFIVGALNEKAEAKDLKRKSKTESNVIQVEIKTSYDVEDMNVEKKKKKKKRKSESSILIE